MTELKTRRALTKDEYNAKLIQGMNLCTHLLFVDMYFAGSIGLLTYEAKTEAKDIGIYRYDIKKRLNQIEEAGKKLMIDFRACERTRVMPTLSYTLETHVNEYRDFGRLTQRMQYGLGMLVKDKRFILWNCIDNWVKNIKTFPQPEKKFWTDIMLMDCLLAATNTFAEAIGDMLVQDVAPTARIDENLRYIHHQFQGMKNQIELLYNKHIRSEEDVQSVKYWKEQAAQALMNLNTKLLRQDAIDLANGQLYMMLRDYSMWWFARIVSELRENGGSIPFAVEADLRKCIKGKPLVLGRLKRTLRHLAKVCTEEDLLDLQDEIFEHHLTKDIEYFIDRAITHNLDPEEADKVLAMVMERSQQKVLTL